MSLPAVAVRRPVTVAMACAAVLLLGAVSVGDLAVELLPKVDTPRLTLVTRADAVSLAPQEIERLVTIPLENQVQTVPGVTAVTSVSREGMSVITAELPWGADLDIAALHVREAVDRVRALLPAGVERPAVLRWDPGAEPVMGVAVVGDASAGALREMVEAVVVTRLEQVAGIAGAQVTGGALREIHVTLDPERLALYGLTVTDVETALEAGNATLQSGNVLQGAIRYQVRALGEFRSIEEIAGVRLAAQGGGQGSGQGSGPAVITLRDVGQVREGVRPQSSGALLDGREAIGLLLFPEAGANTVEAVAAAEQALAELRSQYPELTIEVAFENAGFITEAIASVRQNILLGSLLAFGVLFLFLRDPRSPLLIGIAIPLSIIATFVACSFAGITLNLMTLGGLALGAGLLVDNSIVVLENIDRHRRERSGVDPREAARTGAEEVGMAVAAATFTTIAVFLPIAYVHGVAGELFRPQAWTVTFALLASLAVSLGVLPMLASRGLRQVADEPPPGGRLGRLFDGLLALLLVWPRLLLRAVQWVVEPVLDAFHALYEAGARAHHAFLAVALRHRAVVLVAAAALVASGAWLALRLPWELLPPLDAGRFEVVVDVPPGTPYERLREVVRELDGAARAGSRSGSSGGAAGAAGADPAAGDSAPATLHTFATLGADTGALVSASGAASLSPNRARLAVVAGDSGPAGRAALQAAVARVRAAGAAIPDATITVDPRANPAERLIGGDEAGLEVLVRGADLDELYAVAEQVGAALRGRPGLVDVTAGSGRGNPEIRLRVRRDAAARYGVSVRDVARALQSSLQGTIPTQFVEFDRRIDIRVLALRDETSLDRLLDQPYRTRTGPVPFRELVEATRATGPREIVRRDRAREVVVAATLDGIPLSQAVAEAEAALADLPMPSGVQWEIGGERAEVQRSFSSLRRALLLASALVLMVMAAQFESVLTPFVILLTLPLGWVGVVAALWLTGLSVNVVALIGAVVLTGIVVNDGIVKVDTMNRLRAGGMPAREAVLEGSRLRLRPVLMTTLTTVCALLPLAFGVGAGAELQRPLAVAIIGGEAFGTALTLIVVPVAYLALARWTEPRRQD